MTWPIFQTTAQRNAQAALERAAANGTMYGVATPTPRNARDTVAGGQKNDADAAAQARAERMAADQRLRNNRAIYNELQAVRASREANAIPDPSTVNDPRMRSRYAAMNFLNRAGADIGRDGSAQLGYGDMSRAAQQMVTNNNARSDGNGAYSSQNMGFNRYGANNRPGMWSGGGATPRGEEYTGPGTQVYADNQRAAENAGWNQAPWWVQQYVQPVVQGGQDTIASLTGGHVPGQTVPTTAPRPRQPQRNAYY